jgi:hypothetical protein
MFYDLCINDAANASIISSIHLHSLNTDKRGIF